METSTDDKIELVAALYQAASDSALWPDAMRRLCRLFNANAGHMLLANGAGPASVTAAVMGWSDTALEQYRSHFGAADPFLAVARVAWPNSVVVSQNLVRQAAYERTDFFNNFANPQLSAYHLMGAPISLSDGLKLGLVLLRPKDAGEFDVVS